MDDLEIKGKKYISSKRAAELTGYAKDYIGQLARTGKIPGTRMGRAWYVEAEALFGHQKTELHSRDKTELQSLKDVISPIPRSALSLSFKGFRYTPQGLPDTWGPVRYLQDDFDLIPRLIKSQKDLSNRAIRISEISEDLQEPSRSAIRIKILGERLDSRPQKNKITLEVAQKALRIRRKRNRGNAILSLGALTAALGLFLFFLSGLFLSSDIRFGGESIKYTANILIGFEYIGDFLKQYPVLMQGFTALVGFFILLIGSFWAFLTAGFNFLISIMDFVFVP